MRWCVAPLWIDLKQPPPQVWELVTSPQHLNIWFDPGSEFDLQTGRKLKCNGGTQFRGAVEEVAVLELTQGKSITFHWPVNCVDSGATRGQMRRP